MKGSSVSWVSAEPLTVGSVKAFDITQPKTEPKRTNAATRSNFSNMPVASQDEMATDYP